jgi:hypothetical protein
LTAAIDAYMLERVLHSIALLSFLAAVQPPAEMPAIGVIEVYGARRLTEQQVLGALQLKVSDPFPDARAGREARRRVEAIPGVAQARVNGVCCDRGKTIIFVGIQEVGQPALQFRVEPRGSMRLPDDIVKAGAAFEEAVARAVLSGHAEEDQSQGHSLSNDPATRAIQEQFIAFAARDLPRLRAVLREASDASQRALAAQVIAYTADKRAVIRDLVDGMRDLSDGVRNNAVRALALIAMLGLKNLALGLVVPATPFVDLLNSIEWTDRNKSSLALEALTEGRDPALMAELRARALPSLIEMARWKSEGHAASAFLVLGRLAGLQDDAVTAAFARGDRESVIEAAAKLGK